MGMLTIPMQRRRVSHREAYPVSGSLGPSCANQAVIQYQAVTRPVADNHSRTIRAIDGGEQRVGSTRGSEPRLSVRRAESECLVRAVRGCTRAAIRAKALKEGIAFVNAPARLNVANCPEESSKCFRLGMIVIAAKAATEAQAMNTTD